MSATATRRPATATDVTPGATLYKGNGKVAHRVLWVEPDGGAALCKASTAVDPKRATITPLAQLTVEVAPEPEVAEVEVAEVEVAEVEVAEVEARTAPCIIAARFTAAVDSANAVAPAGFAANAARAALARHESRCAHPDCAQSAWEAHEAYAMRAAEAL